MDVDLLRKRLKEIRESIASGTMPEVPGMENAYQPTSPSPVEPYNPPEVNMPISTNTQAPKTTPVSAPKPVVPAVSKSTNTTKVDPKSGQSGLKAFTDITSKSPQFGEAGIGNTDLIDAYNAGLNGVDLSRETRDNAAAGGYLDSIETMFNAGLQDASLSKNVDGFSPEKVDNTKNLSYTAGNAAGSTIADTVVPVEHTYTANRYGVSNVNNTNNSNTNFQTDHNFARYGQGEDENDVIDVSAISTSNLTSGGSSTYTMSELEKELNYMMDMLYINGATSSSDPSAPWAYEWLTNRDERINDKSFVDDIRKIFYGFMKDLNGSNSNNDPRIQLAVKYVKDHPNQGEKELKKNISAIINSPLFKDDPKTEEDESDANNYIQRNKNNQIVRSLEITGLEGFKNMAKLTDGSYSKEEETIIKEGPYAGCTISQGFNDTTNPTNRGHLGYDIKGDFTAIHPILNGEIVQIQPSQYEYDSNGNRKKDANGKYIIHPDGVTVTVKHINAQGQEFYTTYCHLAEHSVDNLKLGTVTTDSIIGTKGNTGDSTGPHLHVCVYTGAPTKNPMGYSSKPKKVFQNIGTSYTANDYYYPPTAYTFDRKFYDLYLVMLTKGNFISLFPYSKRGE